MSDRIAHIVLCLLFPSKGVLGQSDVMGVKSFGQIVKDEMDQFSIIEINTTVFDKESPLCMGRINFNTAMHQWQKPARIQRILEGNKMRISLFLGIYMEDFFINTKWFYLILGITVLISVIIYILLLNDKHKKQIVFSQDLIKMQEEERHRIALELHDGVAQQLALLARESKKINETRFSDMTIKALDNLRAVSRGLAPAELEAFGLTLGLTEMINEVDEQTDLFFTIDIDCVDTYLDETQSLHFYRITQELLTNIVKHSQAKNVHVNLKKNSKRIKLIVRDDGVGFNVHNLDLYSKSLGMRSIKERCNIINARIFVNSEKGGGTETIVVLHMNQSYRGNFS